MSLLSKAYSSSSFVMEENKITFEILDQKTSITNAYFCTILRLPQTAYMINPKSVSNGALFETYYHMGYKETLTAVSMFRKPNMLPQWNCLFTLLFNVFSERIIGSDCASKLFTTIIYGFYTVLNVDFGAVLQAQVIQRTLSTTRDNEVSYVRF